ncbi:MAG: transketolase family protein [Candidatus Omnitrophica bacterium]|nr:transketolase family protein [Candidatus Omnitrophota bacterium]
MTQTSKIEKKNGMATRDAYGKALAELGAKNPKIIVIDGDLSKSTKTCFFGEKFPERFFNFGIGEANMIGAASGLAANGFIPVCSSFACFIMCKGYDQMRMAMAYSEMNVKVISSHGGISVGEDGVSQQSIEDFALAVSMPKFVVLNPADEFSTRALVFQSVDQHVGPVYMRTGRPAAPIIYDANQKFEMGKGIKLRDGKDVTIVATGLLVWEALVAHEQLKEKGISASVVDIHTLKPLDQDLIIREAKATGAVVTAEEHSNYGGLGSLVAETLTKHFPVPQEYVAVQDTYAESGKPAELLIKYGLTSKEIVQAAEKVTKRKRL